MTVSVSVHFELFRLIYPLKCVLRVESDSCILRLSSNLSVPRETTYFHYDFDNESSFKNRVPTPTGKMGSIFQLQLGKSREF